MSLWVRKPLVLRRRIVLEQLEERIVLDAAVDAASQDNHDQDQSSAEQGQDAPQEYQAEASGSPGPEGGDQGPEQSGEVPTQDLDVVLISNSLDQVEALWDAAVDGAEVLVYDGQTDNLSTLVDDLHDLADAHGKQIGHLAILSHGVPGVLEISAVEQIGVLDALSDSYLHSLGGLLAADARIDLYACNLGAGSEGRAFVRVLAEVTGADVRASDDPTGGSDGDWDLEVRTGAGEDGYLIDGTALADLGVSLAVVDPVVYDQVITPNPAEDTPFTVTVTGRDGKEPDLADVVFTIVTDPAHGTLTPGDKHDLGGGDYSQDFTYTPDQDYYGDDGFQFTMTTPTLGPWKEFDSTPIIIEPAEDNGSPYPSESVGTNDVELGDMDNDGDLDIVTGSDYKYWNLVYINNGNGTFTSHKLKVEGDPAIVETYDIALADIDGDGFLDVVETNDEEVCSDRVYFNHGDGIHFTKANLPNSYEQRSRTADVGDVDNDGDLDIVTGQHFDKTVTVYFNAGGRDVAGWAYYTFDAPNSVYSVKLGDIDNDGNPDLVVGCWTGAYRYLNDGNGNFTSQVKLYDSSYAVAVDLADMDRDGDLDVVAGRGANGLNLYPRIWFNDGSGGFGSPQDIGTESEYTEDIDVADIDNDGDLDVIVSRPGQQSRVYLNDGSTNFTTSVVIGESSWKTYASAIGDIDGDGDSDIVVANDNPPNRIWLNNGRDYAHPDFIRTDIDSQQDTTTSFDVGDLDNDGDLDIVAGSDGQENRTYDGDGTGSFMWSGNIGDHTDNTRAIKLGDLDNDGDLDVVVGNDGSTNKAYFNDGSGGFAPVAPFWISVGNETDATHALELADFNRDGFLDVIVGNDGVNRVYLGDGSGGFQVPTDWGAPGDNTRAIRLADLDNDGDLDAIAGNVGGTNKVYTNDNGVLTHLEDLGGSYDTFALTVGDMDNDGDLDIIAGNSNQVNRYFRNWLNESLFHAPGFYEGAAIGSETDDTRSLSLADLDFDGDLDLLVGNYEDPNRVYLNNGSGSFSYAEDVGDGTEATRAILAVDVNSDGLFDVITGNSGQENSLYTRAGTTTSDAATVRMTIDSVPDNPTGGNDGVTTPEEVDYVFAASDFTFNDGDIGDTFDGIRVVTVETAGDLEYNGSDVTADQIISDVSHLVFKPAQDGFGDPYATFTFKVRDSTGAYSDAAYTMSITVTNVPDNPTGSDDSVTADEDVPFTFAIGDFTFNDVDGDTFNGIRIVAVETAGDLEYSGAGVVPGQDISDVTQLVFTSGLNEFGEDYATFTFSVRDSSGALSDDTYTMTIDVNSVNDEPTYTGPTTATADEDVPVEIGPFTGEDNDPEVVQGLTFWLKGGADLSNGDLYRTETDAQNRTDAINLSGAAVKVTWGTSVWYMSDPDDNADTSFDLYVTDDGGTAYGGDDTSPDYTVDITVRPVNDEPSYTGPTDVTANEDQPLEVAFAGNDGDPEVQALTYWLKGGADLSNGDLYRNVTDAQNRTNAIDLYGADVEVTWGTSVWYMSDPDDNVDTSFDLYVTDDGGTAYGGDDTSPDYTVDITVRPVNDEPSYTGPTTATADEDVPVEIGPFTGEDNDPEVVQNLTFWLTGGADLSNGDLYRTETDAQNRTNPISLSGTDVEVTWGLSVWYLSDSDDNADTSFDLYVTDDGGTAYGGDDTSPDCTVDITVQPVNDAPMITGPTAMSLKEDTSLTITGISVDDVDVDETAPPDNTMEMTLKVDHGTLSVSAPSVVTFSVGDGTDDSIMIFTGTQADINTALASVEYVPFPDYYGSDNLVIVADDQGHSGSGGPCVVNGAISLTVEGVPEFDEFGKSYVDDGYSLPTEAEGYGGPLSTGGSMPGVGNLLSILSDQKPESSFFEGSPGTGEGSHYPGGGSFGALLDQALYGEDWETRNREWEALLGYTSDGKDREGQELWLNLEEFSSRLRERQVGTSLDDVLLVFNADDVRLAESVNSFGPSIEGPNDASGHHDAGLPGSTGEATEGKNLVFNLDDMKAADILTEGSPDGLVSDLDGTSTDSEEGVSRVYDLAEMSFLDAAAGVSSVAAG